MFFFEKRFLKSRFDLTSSVSSFLRSRLARIAPRTALGIALRHFQECKATTGGREAVNPPGREPNIWPDLRIRRSKSQIWSNVRLLPGGFPASPPPVVDLHSWKCLRAISKAVVGTMRDKRERRTSSQKMLGQNVILEIVFRKKHAKFEVFKILIS